MAVRDVFSRLSSYTVYYGSFEAVTLSKVDAVIIEPMAYTPQQVREMRDAGILVIGYTSVMEAGPHLPYYSQLEETDFLHDVNGNRVSKAEYGNDVLDLTSAHWRGMFFYEVGKLLTEQGYDGVFLDTVGNVELARLPTQSQQLTAAVDVVAQLRQWFPTKILVQNNGLELLTHRTAPYIDAILWENPPLTDKKSAEWVKRMRDKLKDLTKRFNVRVLVLFDGVEFMSRRQWIISRSFADESGFIASFSPRHYLGESVREVDAPHRVHPHEDNHPR